jgi:hypothetical protein
MIASSITIGATNSGEAIDFEGGVDEFTFSATAGQVVTGLLNAPFAFDGAYVKLDIVDPSTENVLGCRHHSGPESLAQHCAASGG